MAEIGEIEANSAQIAAITKSKAKIKGKMMNDMPAMTTSAALHNCAGTPRHPCHGYQATPPHPADKVPKLGGTQRWVVGARHL